MSWGSPDCCHGWYSTCQQCLGKVCGNSMCGEPKCVLPCASSCYTVDLLSPIKSQITSTIPFGGGELNLTFSGGTNGWEGGGVLITELPSSLNTATDTSTGIGQFINTQALGSPPSFTSTITVSGFDANIASISGFSGGGKLTVVNDRCRANISGQITVNSQASTQQNIVGNLHLTGNGDFSCCDGCPVLTVSNINFTGSFTGVPQ